MANGNEVDLNKIFCVNAKKYNLEKLFLKAVAITESNLDPNAYRMEPKFWERYLKNHSEWKDRKPEIVSASWGIYQLMFTTAWSLGLRTQPDEKMAEDLKNPVINAELGAKYLRQLLDKILSNKNDRPDIKYVLNPLAIACSRYNAGGIGNPNENGELRNKAYVNKVFSVWHDLIKKETECDETNSTG